MLGATAPAGPGLSLGNPVATLGILGGANDGRATFGLYLWAMVSRLSLGSFVAHRVPLVGCDLPKAHRRGLAVTS